MNIGIVGLGLIGGSLAMAIKKKTSHTVGGTDIQEGVVRKALLSGVIDTELTPDNLSSFDLVFLALYPQTTIDFVRTHADRFSPDGIVLDVCGTKSTLCAALQPLARQKGFYFIGGHPMAGREFSGFHYAQATLFENASMVLTPDSDIPLTVMEHLESFCRSLGFTTIQITTPDEHDRMIAFTSQLAHVVSSAYVKSETATEHFGFSAGSFKDMTRVARLNETMWTELFMDNRVHLCHEIRQMIEHLSEFENALETQNREELFQLLKTGHERKAVLDTEPPLSSSPTST